MGVRAPKLPQGRTLLGIIDAEQRAGLQRAVDLTAAQVRTHAPGGLGAAYEGRVTRTPTGHRGVVQPRRNARRGQSTAAEIARWVNRGTGVHRVGPGPKRPIRSKRIFGTMTLPGGKKVRSVQGQRPNPFVANASARALPRVERELEQAGRQAAVRLAREIGGRA